MRTHVHLILLIFLLCASIECRSQADPKLQDYFKNLIGLNDQQIGEIRAGKAVVKNLKSRVPDEIFLFGAVYVNSDPRSYVERALDYRHRSSLPGFLAVGTFSDPPQPNDVKGFTLEPKDLEALKGCKPGECDVQMPGPAIQEFKALAQSSEPDASQRVNQQVQKKVLALISAYRRGGDSVLGMYNDKENPVNIAGEFKDMLSFSKALPKYLPDFYDYLLNYPQKRPSHVEDALYWAKIEFGLKPTLRIMHVITLQRDSRGAPAFVVAEKQLYASHYFRTALDLTYCIPEQSSSGQRGFYLIKVMGSEQGGLTGFKGSLVRKKVVSGSESSLRKSLEAWKKDLEAEH